jgi:NADH-quinone oxidoreductase subunit E
MAMSSVGHKSVESDGDVLPDLSDHEVALRAIAAREGSDVVAILQAVQHRLGWLPRNAVELIASCTGLSLARLWSVATFYASFHLQPRGRTVVRVCRGTACHVRGAARISDALAKHLGVAAGSTTADLAYTLDEVACLGCCSLAPVVTVGDEVYGKLGQRDAIMLLERVDPEEPT